MHNLRKAMAFMSRVETDFCFFCSFVPTVIFLSLLALIPRFATTFAAKKDKAVPSSRRRPVMIGWTLINYLAPTPLPTREPVGQNTTIAKMSFESHHVWALYYTVWLVLVVILFFHGLCCKPIQCTSKSKTPIWRDSLIKRRNSI